MLIENSRVYKIRSPNAILILILGVLFGVVGIVIPVSPLPAAAITLSLVGVLAIFLIGERFLLWAMVVSSFLLVGPAETIGRVPKVFWIPYLAGGFLLVKSIVSKKNTRVPKGDFRAFEYGPISALVAIFVVVGLLSSVYSDADLFSIILGSRDYFWIWGFFFLVLAIDCSVESQGRFFDFLKWLVVIQVPFVIYQHFFVIGSTRLATHDAVVGLFGGNPEGGGASGAMGFFSLLMALYVIAQRRNSKKSLLATFLIIASALVSIAFAEVKFVAIALPVVAAAFIGPRVLIRSPIAWLWLAIFIVAGPLILYGYWKLYEAPGARGYGSFEKYVSVVVERNTDNMQINRVTGEMGRVAALKFWSMNHRLEQEPVEFLFGHGIGSSRIGTFPGQVAKKYSFNIARSSLAVLLWETGVAGVLVVVTALLIAWKRASDLAAKAAPQNGNQKSLLQLSAGVFVVSLISLPYNLDFLGTPQFQLLLVMCSAVTATAYVREKRKINGATE